MAGDWIKMRVDLSDDPAVIVMSATLKINNDEVVGKLHRLWSWADKHTIDGCAPAVTPKWVDHYVDKVGFAEAMSEIGWLQSGAHGITFPRFDRHNGRSAKLRATNSRRQKHLRSVTQLK